MWESKVIRPTSQTTARNQKIQIALKKLMLILMAMRNSYQHENRQDNKIKKSQKYLLSNLKLRSYFNSG